MKTTQYVRQEKAIAAADTGSIRARWLWGLRLLRDTDAFAPGSSQLKPGRLDELVAAAKAAGLALSRTEIQYRLRCARAYPTETQIAQAVGQFRHWSELFTAGFPAYDASPDEPLADHRADAEREQDRKRELLDLMGDQYSLFPLRHFEPVTATLKELAEYAEEQRELTARFAEHDAKRLAYLERLVEAAGGDLSMTWAKAHDRLAEGGGPS